VIPAPAFSLAELQQIDHYVQQAGEAMWRSIGGAGSGSSGVCSRATTALSCILGNGAAATEAALRQYST
jgi:hypothetical protein